MVPREVSPTACRWVWPSRESWYRAIDRHEYRKSYLQQQHRYSNCQRLPYSISMRWHCRTCAYTHHKSHKFVRSTEFRGCLSTKWCGPDTSLLGTSTTKKSPLNYSHGLQSRPWRCTLCWVSGHPLRKAQVSRGTTHGYPHTRSLVQRLARYLTPQWAALWSCSIVGASYALTATCTHIVKLAIGPRSTFLFSQI